MTQPNNTWDPDRDGKPGIAWTSVAVIVAVIAAVVILALYGRIDLDALITLALGAAASEARSRLTRRAP